MTNKYTFRSMTFVPIKLIELRKELEKKYEESEFNSIKTRAKKRLPDLLKRIRALEMKNEIIDEFGLSLTKNDVLILAYEYPYHQEETDTIKKVVQILILRYVKEVGRAAWRIFQNEVNDNHLHRLLNVTFEKEEPDFLGLDKVSREQLTYAIGSENIIYSLVQTLINSSQKAYITLQNWKVQNNSMLWKLLIKFMLIKGLEKDNIIHREGTSKILEYMNQYPLKEYKEILRSYLTSRSFEEFKHNILADAINKLGDPRKDDRPWQFISEAIMEQVHKWLIQSELQKFFEHDQNNQRFMYWKKHIKDMKTNRIIKEPSIVFMEFGEFVVVEYGEVGDAAYFYHTKGFEQIFIPKLNSYKFRNTRSKKKKKDMFKERGVYHTKDGIELYINKLDHRGGWYSTFDAHMYYYLKGNFHFRRY